MKTKQERCDNKLQREEIEARISSCEEGFRRAGCSGRSSKSTAGRSRGRTLSQRIRTIAEIPIEAAILDADAPPVYQQIAPKAVQLQQLGMNNSAIARRLGVNDKTVAKAVAWFQAVQLPPCGR